MRRILTQVGLVVAALAVIAGYVYVKLNGLPFGPGAHVLLEVEVPDSSAPQVLDRVMEETAGILRKRMDPASVRRVGARRLMVGLSGSPDLARLLPAFTTRGTFGIYLVDDSSANMDIATHDAPIGETAYASPQGRVAVFNRNLLDGSHIVDATSDFGTKTGKPVVSIRWDEIGAARLAKITAEHVHHRIALIRDGKLLFTPVIDEPITGGGLEISGDFTVEQTGSIARLLRGGMLPARVLLIDSGPGLPK